MTQRIEISYKTILFTIAAILALWLLFVIRDIVLLIALAIVAASGLRPIVDGLENYKIPRIMAILIVYVFLSIILFVIIAGIIPILTNETERLIDVLWSFPDKLSPYIDYSPNRWTNQLAGLSGGIVNAAFGIVSSLVYVFTFFALTFYMLLERRHLRVFLRNLVGEEYKERIVRVTLKIEDRLGAWVRGEFSLMLIIGVMTYIGLNLLRVDYALPLAIIAGLFEIIPLVGPIIAAIPAVIVAYLINPWLAVVVILLYFGIQQLENHIAVPLVMKRAVGVPPMVSIIAILIGIRLAGVVGAILAVPFFVSLQVLFEEVFTTSKSPKKNM